MNSSDVCDMIYAQIGLVTDYTYSFALDPNQDGDPSDAEPQYLFNQNAAMRNAISSGTPFAAPLAHTFK